LPSFAVVNPFSHSTEASPQRPSNTSHSISFALIKEIFTPTTIPLSEQLFIFWTSRKLAGIPKAWIFARDVPGLNATVFPCV